ncbi:DUF6090 family protein [Gaetbulibacter sp. M240]|uniref:DUF6090 family protein n=1 Tax=Gaetbulibacter sp. M240 TaxID=3126511 RepID=UPI00374F40DA
MIKFFRKIRQKLITENKFNRYFLYAIGEIILVVIGILIALQVNNWNNDRIIERNTNESLKSLKNELTSNKEKLKFNINIAKGQIVNGLNLIDSLNNHNDVEDKDKFLLDKIGNLGPLRIKTLTTTTLGEFVNASNSGLILPDAIKNYLLVYNSEIKNLDFALDRFEEYWKGIELPYLTKHFSILDMYTQRISNSKTQDSILEGTTILLLNNKKSYFKNNLEAFYNNREFASMYTSRFADLRVALNAMIRLDHSIDDLIQSINNKNDI